MSPTFSAPWSRGQSETAIKQKRRLVAAAVDLLRCRLNSARPGLVLKESYPLLSLPTKSARRARLSAADLLGADDAIGWFLPHTLNGHGRAQREWPVRKPHGELRPSGIARQRPQRVGNGIIHSRRVRDAATGAPGQRISLSRPPISTRLGGFRFSLARSMGPATIASGEHHNHAI